MVIAVAELSPSQKAALEELLGHPLRDKDSVDVRTFPSEKSVEQKAAAESLAKFLVARSRPRPGVSDEERESVILEALRSERPHYTPVS